jgi:hypothetical protein
VIFSPELVDEFKMEKRDFTRKRKLPFVATMLFMLNSLRKSLAIEIDGFVRHLKEYVPFTVNDRFTTSTFVQNRQKIKPTVFSRLSEVIIENYYTADNDTLRHLHGFRVLAVDGSTLMLPFTAELKEYYGIAKNQHDVDVVKARVSVLYDVLNRITLDAVIEKLSTGERELALRHARQWKKGDLIIYDRGYPSYDLIHEHIKQGIDCLTRVSAGYSAIVSAFVATGKKSVITEIYPGKNISFGDKEYGRHSGLTVRLLRIELPSAEIEVLMTTLTDSQKYPAKLFKELYFLRWGIETFYDELKNKLKVEYFTGYSKTTIQQDFFCAIFISNLQSVIVNDLEEELAAQNEGKKYKYRVNTNLSYGFLKNRILELLYKDAPLDEVFKELEELFLKNTVPIRNDRNNFRNIDKYKLRIKPKVTKNQRDAI